MSNLAARLELPLRPVIGGNPELTRADVHRAVEALERMARGLVKPGVRHSLHVLLSFMNVTSLICNPSQVTLSTAIGCNRDTLVRHLKLLEAAGLLWRVSLPVQRGRRGRESDWYSFDFARVGLPELRWKPPSRAKPTGRRPVRAADGRFRRAADAVLPMPSSVSDLLSRVVAAADPDQTRAESSASLRMARASLEAKPSAALVVSQASLRQGDSPSEVSTVSASLGAMLAAMRERERRGLT